MDDVAFAKIWNDARTVRDAAAAAGMSIYGAHNRAKRLGLPRKANRSGPPSDLSQIVRVKELRAEGMTYREIRAVTGKGMRFVHKYGSQA